jgi:hypothetical protein
LDWVGLTIGVALFVVLEPVVVSTVVLADDTEGAFVEGAEEFADVLVVVDVVAVVGVDPLLELVGLRLEVIDPTDGRVGVVITGVTVVLLAAGAVVELKCNCFLSASISLLIEAFVWTKLNASAWLCGADATEKLAPSNKANTATDMDCFIKRLFLR